MLSDIYYKHKLYCFYYVNIMWIFSEILFVKECALLNKNTEYIVCTTLVNWLTSLSIVFDSWQLFIQSVNITKSTIWDALLCRLVEIYFWEISRFVRLHDIVFQKTVFFVVTPDILSSIRNTFLWIFQVIGFLMASPVYKSDNED
jgi:hypothetical protein